MSKRSFAFTLDVAVFGVAVAAFLAGCSNRETPAESPIGSSDLVAAHSPIVGPADAPVTIVEFFDPACEGCAAFHPVVKSVLAEFPSGARLVYRYLPFHRGSDQAVGILEGARAQGRFEAVMDALLARQSEWASHGRENLDAAWSIAAASGLDLERARAVATSTETKRIIEQDLTAAREFRIQQTPTVFVDGQMLESYDREGLAQRVRDELAKRED